MIDKEKALGNLLEANVSLCVSVFVTFRLICMSLTWNGIVESSCNNRGNKVTVSLSDMHV